MKYDTENINILGINISRLKQKEIFNKIQNFLNSKKQNYIVTVNPEIILEAIGHDEEFFYIVNSADLAIPDGVGLKFAAWVMGKNIYRFPGANLVEEILLFAEENNEKLVIFNWVSGLSKKEDIENCLKQKYHKLNFLVKNIEREGECDFSEINILQPKLMLVNLGVPWQEKFIYHNLAKVPSVKVGIGIGGSLDFLTGKTVRAPKIFRSLGLEWLWRLINIKSFTKKGERIRRIFGAIFKFPWEFIKWHFVYQFFYRPNVVCLLYKRENDKFKILIVERTDCVGHWQLPQGGTDGEKLFDAGKRELSEEINSNNFKPIKDFPELHQYEFGDSMGKYMVPARLSRGYKGQKQGLFVAEFLGRDSEIKMNFWEHRNWKWVDSEKLVDSVFESRRRLTKIFYNKFLETISK